MKGFLYFVRCSPRSLSNTGRGRSRYPIKIGSTADVQARLVNLQTASPYELTLLLSVPCEEPRRVERAWHERFARDRIRGEWFWSSDMLLAAIDVIKRERSADLGWQVDSQL